MLSLGILEAAELAPVDLHELLGFLEFELLAEFIEFSLVEHISPNVLVVFNFTRICHYVLTSLGLIYKLYKTMKRGKALSNHLIQRRLRLFILQFNCCFIHS